MADEFVNSEQLESSRKPMPDAPACVGKTLEEIRIMLAANHQNTVSLDDPILMLVSILNAYLSEFEALHVRHNQALSEIITAKTAEYIFGVKQTTDAMTKTLSEASVEGIKKSFDDQAGRLKSFEHNLFWCTALVALSAFINAALYILK